MDRPLTRLTLIALALGAVTGPFVSFGARAPARAETVVPPTSAEDETAERLHWLDGEIARRAERGERGSWVDLEWAAQRRLERHELTGRYDDFRAADEALDRALALAPPGSGPVLARLTLDFTLHRIAAVEARLPAVGVLWSAGERRTVETLRAETAFYAGRYDEARERYAALLSAERDPEALVLAAQFAWRTGARDDADALLAEAEASAEARSVRGWVCLVRALFELDGERWDEAEAAVERGLELRPGWWQLEEHSAQLLRERSALGDARLIYESIVERTESPEALDALALIARAERRDDDAALLAAEARALHERRLALLPEAAAGHAIDHFLFVEDAPERLVELAELNAHARPFGEAQARLALAYARAGRWDDALGVVYALEETPWSTPESEAVSALVLERAGDDARAARHRERARALAPTVLDRTEALLP